VEPAIPTSSTGQSFETRRARVLRLHTGRIQAESDGEKRVGVHVDTIGCLLDRQLPSHLGKEP
jgi:hypothetical protein